MDAGETGSTAEEARAKVAGKEGEEEGGSRPKVINFEHQADDLGVTCLQDLKIDTLGRDSKMLQGEVAAAAAAAASTAASEMMPPPPPADETPPSSRSKVASYRDIRGRFPQLFNKEGGGKADPEASGQEQPKKVNRTLFEAEESEKEKDSHPQKDLQKTPSSSSIKSNTQLVGTPVTENDPLGALRTPENSPVQESREAQQGLHKSATLPSAKPGDDILGENTLLPRI